MSKPKKLGEREMPPVLLDPFDLTVVVVNYNTAALLPRMFSALERAALGLRVQVIVIDNASRDNSVDILNIFYSAYHLIKNPTNMGFGRANNLAIPYLQSEYVLLLNTDAFVAEDSLQMTLEYIRSHPSVGVLGARLVGQDGAVQPSCRYFPTPWNIFLQASGLSRFFPRVRLIDADGFAPKAVQACDWVPGCFYLTRRSLIQQCGLFDPRFFLYFEEVDHCRTAKAAGWEVVYFPGTNVVHLGGESAKSDGPLSQSGNQISSLQVESETLYLRKHHGLGGLVLHVALNMALALLLCTKGWLKALLGRASYAAVLQPLAAQRLRFTVLLATQFGLVPLR